MLSTIIESFNRVLNPEKELVPIRLNNENFNEDLIFEELNKPTLSLYFSKLSPSIYRSTIKGFTLKQYTEQGSVIEKDGEDYFLETDSFIEKIVLGIFRKGFEKKYNGNLTTTNDDFITSRKEFYENDISNLPVLSKIKDIEISNDSFLTKGYSDMANMALYLKNQNYENKVTAIESLFESLNQMHEQGFIVGDPTTYIVQYAQNDNRSYFTNLRFARRSDKNEDYAREISQFIISASLNSGLKIEEAYNIFSQKYNLNQNIVIGMEKVTENDNKKVNAFSNWYRNLLSKQIFGKDWDQFKEDRKKIYELIKNDK